MKILIINGVNLNMLGIRERNIYGTMDMRALQRYIRTNCRGHRLRFVTENCEGRIVDAIHKAYFRKVDGIVINPGAYTHYSYAIYDAIKAVNLPVVEVHLSDIHAREDFRKRSVTAPACIAQIYGKGEKGYVEAVDCLSRYLQQSATSTVQTGNEGEEHHGKNGM